MKTFLTILFVVGLYMLALAAVATALYFHESFAIVVFGAIPFMSIFVLNFIDRPKK